MTNASPQATEAKDSGHSGQEGVAESVYPQERYAERHTERHAERHE
jgi:hypothetical protein